MSPFTITNALVMPGVSAVDSGWSVWVGLVVDDRWVGWGVCAFDAAESDPGLLNDYILILQELIIPALMGRPLSDMAALMEGIDGMRHEVTLVRPVTAETPPQKRSRRDLFSSLLNPEEEIREVVERPLPPGLRFGVIQALVSAAAEARDVTVVEVVAGLYGLSPARSPLPVHLVFEELPNTADPALAQISAASYGLTVSDENPHKELGGSGVRFQNRVRQLKNRAAGRQENGRPQHPPAFLFDLKGGYGALYEHNTGAILGAINGLEQTTKGHVLRLADPVLLADFQSQIEVMKELRQFLRFRKMETRLFARGHVETTADIHALADEGCCDGVLLEMARLGTLNRTVDVALAARERGLEVVLAGTGVHMALALNPVLLAVGVGEVAGVVDEMRRTAAWLEYKGFYGE